MIGCRRTGAHHATSDCPWRHHDVLDDRGRRAARPRGRVALLRRRCRQHEVLAARSDPSAATSPTCGSRGDGRRPTTRSPRPIEVQPGTYEDTPLMANGVMYTITALGVIAAIDPGTGQTIWQFDPETLEGRPAHEPGLPAPRPRLLDRRQDRTPARRHARRLPDLGRRQDRHASTPASASGGRVDLTERLAFAERVRNYTDHVCAGRRPQRRHRRREHLRRPAEQGSGARRRERVRRADRQAAVDVPLDPAGRASSATTRGKATPPSTPAIPTCGR